MPRLMRFLATTAIGGLFFLLPLIVIGALIGQMVPLILAIARSLHTFLPVETATGIALLVAAAIAVLLGLCFAAGLVARRSVGRRLLRFIEQKVAMFFPRYAVIREQMAGTLSSSDHGPRLKPVIAQFDDVRRVAFEVERSDRAVVIYLPGSPDPWSGCVAYVRADQVEPLTADFLTAVATCEQMGRGAGAIDASDTKDPT